MRLGACLVRPKVLAAAAQYLDLLARCEFTVNLNIIMSVILENEKLTKVAEDKSNGTLHLGYQVGLHFQSLIPQLIQVGQI